MLDDVRYAWRAIWATPIATGLAILAIGLAAAANTVVLTLREVVVAPASESRGRAPVVELHRQFKDAPPSPWFSLTSFRRLQDSSRALERIAGLGTTMVSLQMSADAQIERVPCALVTPGYFQLMDVPARHGRLLSAEDNSASVDEPIVLVSSAFFASHMGGDAARLGTGLWLNRQVFTVVGVLPDFVAGSIVGFEPSIYAPASYQPLLKRISRGATYEQRVAEDARYPWLVVTGRARPGLSVAEVSTDLAQLTPESRSSAGVKAVPLARSRLPLAVRADAIRAVSSFEFIAALFLLVSVGNLIILMVQRTLRRSPQTDTRMALGASVLGAVRPLICEVLLLTGLGGSVGCVLGCWLLAGARSLFPPFVRPLNLTLSPGAGTLVGTLALWFACGLVCSVPVWLWNLRRQRSPRRSRTEGALLSRGLCAHRVVVGTQAVLASLLLVWAIALVQQLLRTNGTQLGFEPVNLAVAVLNLDLLDRSGPASERAGLLPRLLAAAQSIPGVEGASLSTGVPLRPPNDILAITARPESVTYIDTVGVTAGFFELMGIPVIRGRAVQRGDDGTVVVLNQAGLQTEREIRIARKLPLDHQGLGNDIMGRTVVGIVGDTRRDQLQVRVEPTRYLLLSGEPPARVYLVLRSRLEPGMLDREIRTLLQRVAPAASLDSLRRYTDYIRYFTWAHRISAAIGSAIASLALVVAVFGSFSVAAYSAISRRREIALRVALGALPSRIARSGVYTHAAVVAIGSVAGGVSALVLGHAARAVWLDIPALEYSTVVGVASFCTCVLGQTAYWPLRIPTRSAPFEALRHE